MTIGGNVGDMTNEYGLGPNTNATWRTPSCGVHCVSQCRQCSSSPKRPASIASTFCTQEALRCELARGVGSCDGSYFHSTWNQATLQERIDSVAG